MKVGYPIETSHFYYSYYKDFDVLVILPMKFGFEAPSMKLCHKISLLSLPVSRKERLLSLGPILCRGLGLLTNCPANQHSFICGQGECKRYGHFLIPCLHAHIRITITSPQKQFTRLRKTAQKCYEQYIKSVFEPLTSSHVLILIANVKAQCPL